MKLALHLFRSKHSNRGRHWYWDLVLPKRHKSVLLSVEVLNGTPYKTAAIARRVATTFARRHNFVIVEEVVRK